MRYINLHFTYALTLDAISRGSKAEVFTGRIPFLSPKQCCLSAEGRKCCQYFTPCSVDQCKVPRILFHLHWISF